MPLVPFDHVRFSASKVHIKRDSEVRKPAVVGIAAAVTAVVVVLILGFLIWCFRRRRARRLDGHERRDYADSRQERPADLHCRTSKIPLIRHEERPQVSEPQDALISESRRDEDAASPAVDIRRAMSKSTVQSLPPSYAVATQIFPTSQHDHDPDEPFPGNHRPSSNAVDSTGLRPLLLSTARHQPNDRARTGLLESEDNDDTLSGSQSRTVRPRSSSRFHEEDLDG